MDIEDILTLGFIFLMTALCAVVIYRFFVVLG